MTPRQLGWIFGILVVMVAAWLLLRNDSDQRPGDGLDLAEHVATEVSRVRIDPPGEEPIRLENRGGDWTVNGYPALDSLVAATVGRLDTLPPGRLVSRSAANHERLGLTTETGVRVRFGTAESPDLDMLVGEAGTDGRFVRLADADPAYVFSAEVLDPFAGGERTWRDFTIARVDTATLRRIVVRRGGEVAAELLREDPTDDGEASGAGGGGWRVNELPADTALMRAYAETLAHLEATGFPADSFAFAADFENPAASVELYTDPDPRRPPDLTLLFSTGLDHPDALVRRGDDPIVYAIDRRRANLLTTTAERLRAAE